MRSMLVYKKQAEQLRQEKAALTVAFEVRRRTVSKLLLKINLEETLFVIDFLFFPHHWPKKAPLPLIT